MSIKLRAEFYWDAESGNWHYRVPALHINGGGTATRDEAATECMEAIRFALEGDPGDYDGEALAMSLDVVVTSAA